MINFRNEAMYRKLETLNFKLLAEPQMLNQNFCADKD